MSKETVPTTVIMCYVVILDRRRDEIAAREAHASLGHTAVYVQY